MTFTDSPEVAPFDTCPWLVEVPSGNPEPDSPSDCWLTVECGAPVTFDGDAWSCEAGHGHRGVEAEWAADALRERAEREGRS
jgi:hypothetical protein